MTIAYKMITKNQPINILSGYPKRGVEESISRNNEDKIPRTTCSLSEIEGNPLNSRFSTSFSQQCYNDLQPQSGPLNDYYIGKSDYLPTNNNENLTYKTFSRSSSSSSSTEISPANVMDITQHETVDYRMYSEEPSVDYSILYSTRGWGQQKRSHNLHPQMHVNTEHIQYSSLAGMDKNTQTGAQLQIVQNETAAQRVNDSIIKSTELNRVFECSACPKSFSSRHHLARHYKSVHTTERPYSCELCDRTFKRRDHVVQHKNKKKKCVQL